MPISDLDPGVTSTPQCLFFFSTSCAYLYLHTEMYFSTPKKARSWSIFKPNFKPNFNAPVLSVYFVIHIGYSTICCSVFRWPTLNFFLLLLTGMNTRCGKGCFIVLLSVARSMAKQKNSWNSFRTTDVDYDPFDSIYPTVDSCNPNFSLHFTNTRLTKKNH